MDLINELIYKRVWEKNERRNQHLFIRIMQDAGIPDKEIEAFFSKYPPPEISDIIDFYQIDQSDEQKSDWIEIKEILLGNNIHHLYHFTDTMNIHSIKNNNGIYSLEECKKRGIKISTYSSSEDSRIKDTKYGLSNYVRLSFVRNHPMKFIAVKEKRITSPVVLEISTDVLFLKDTLISDTNTLTINSKIGLDAHHLKQVKFDIIKSYKYYYHLKESERPFYQAEILVKEHVPLKYISNL